MRQLGFWFLMAVVFVGGFVLAGKADFAPVDVRPYGIADIGPKVHVYKEVYRGCELYIVVGDLNRAMQKHGPMKSAHEAYGVILEELDEFWDEVKKKRPSSNLMRGELTQLAAMAVRAICDLNL